MLNVLAASLTDLKSRWAFHPHKILCVEGMDKESSKQKTLSQFIR